MTTTTRTLLPCTLLLLNLCAACDTSGETFRNVQAEPAERAIAAQDWTSPLDGDLKAVVDEGNRRLAAQGTKAQFVWGAVYGNDYIVEDGIKTVHWRYVVRMKGDCFTGELEMIRRHADGAPEPRGASPVDVDGNATGTFIHCAVAERARGGVHVTDHFSAK